MLLSRYRSQLISLSLFWRLKLLFLWYSHHYFFRKKATFCDNVLFLPENIPNTTQNSCFSLTTLTIDHWFILISVNRTVTIKGALLSWFLRWRVFPHLWYSSSIGLMTLFGDSFNCVIGIWLVNWPSLIFVTALWWIWFH